MNGIFAKPLRGKRYRERSRILQLARSGRPIDNAADARVVEELLRSELSARETRSWLWQLSVMVAIVGAMFWWRDASPAPLSGGIGAGVIFIMGSVWARIRYRKTARANGWSG